METQRYPSYTPVVLWGVCGLQLLDIWGVAWLYVLLRSSFVLVYTECAVMNSNAWKDAGIFLCIAYLADSVCYICWISEFVCP